VGIAVGVGTAFALTRTYLWDFAPIALTLCLALGVLAGVAVTPRPARQRSVASLRTRRVRDYVPAHVWRLPAAIALGFLVLAQFRTPELPDHETQYFLNHPPASLTSAMITMAVAVVLACPLVWAVVRSPQSAEDSDGVAADEVWRRTTVHTIVHACAGLLAIIYTGTAFWYADSQMDWRGGGSPTMGVGLSVLAGFGLVAALRHLGALVLPGPPTSQSPAPVGEPALEADRT
jgi:hypothetical protein